jgi:hypothetical protein
MNNDCIRCDDRIKRSTRHVYSHFWKVALLYDAVVKNTPFRLMHVNSVINCNDNKQWGVVIIIRRACLQFFKILHFRDYWQIN